jgi:hypothetical protein
MGAFVVAIILGVLLEAPNTINPIVTAAGLTVEYLSITLIPITITIGVLRYRLWDLEIVIRKTLTYGLLTALLASAYFGLVILMQTIIGRAAKEQSPLVIVFSTLLIAALFSPLRRRVQTFIDRRFYRRKYNAAQILAAFAAQARDEVDMDRLAMALLAVVDTLQPEQVCLWFSPALKATRRPKFRDID